jgi:hypothetical protein
LPAPSPSRAYPLRPNLSPAHVLEAALLRLTDKQWARAEAEAMEAQDAQSAARSIERAALRVDPGAAEWIKRRQEQMQRTREALAQDKTQARTQASPQGGGRQGR